MISVLSTILYVTRLRLLPPPSSLLSGGGGWHKQVKCFRAWCPSLLTSSLIGLHMTSAPTSLEGLNRLGSDGVPHRRFHMVLLTSLTLLVGSCMASAVVPSNTSNGIQPCARTCFRPSLVDNGHRHVWLRPGRGRPTRDASCVSRPLEHYRIDVAAVPLGRPKVGPFLERKQGVSFKVCRIAAGTYC